MIESNELSSYEKVNEATGIQYRNYAECLGIIIDFLTSGDIRYAGEWDIEEDDNISDVRKLADKYAFYKDRSGDEVNWLRIDNCFYSERIESLQYKNVSLESLALALKYGYMPLPC